MAEKRMFSKRVISSDAFLDMPATAQVLYFHLSLMADDDGFVDSPRSVMRSIGAAKEDMDMLLENKYIIYFQEKGVSVIRHWNVSNSIRGDRYKETKYKELKSRLSLDESGSYNILEQNQPGTEPQPNDNQPGTEPQPNVTIDQIRLDQVSIDKIKKEKESEDPSPSFPPFVKIPETPALPQKNYAMVFEEVKAKWKEITGQETKETLFQVSSAKREKFINTLAIYSLDDIFNAIGNYQRSRDHPENFDIGGRIYGSLIGFLENGVIQFYKDEIAEANFRRRKK
jgi:hypothetical protein